MSWSQNGGNNPWGSAPPRSGGGGRGGGGSGSGGSGGGGGRPPPSLENIIEMIQKRFSRILDPHSGNLLRRLLLVAVGLLLLWAASGLYRVDQGEMGLELVFGKYYGPPTPPGLNYNFPRPVGRVFTPQVERARRLDIGFRTIGEANETNQRVETRDVEEESLILTADQNIVDIDFTVFWKISDPAAYLFNIRDPQSTIKIASESAMREVIGQSIFDDAVTVGRAQIENKTLILLQDILDGYKSGIQIEKIDLQKSDPPQQVIDSFNDVQRARQDLDRLRNQAQAYANTVVPEARGEAEQMIRRAEGYRGRVIKEAEGEAERFLQVWRAYRSAPAVTRRRMYLETIGQIFERSNIVVIDKSSGSVVPYLPLPELKRGQQQGKADAK